MDATEWTGPFETEQEAREHIESTYDVDADTGDNLDASEWQRHYDAVVLAAWEQWTKNGLNLDHDEREQTIKSVRDAATNVWCDGMTDSEWHAATMSRLTGK